MKHTPGPWKCGSDEPFVYALNTAGTNRFFASVQPGWLTDGSRNRADDERTPNAELIANARLIAAAPELLEALQLILDTYGFDSSTDSAIWKTATAAIEKARGES